MKRIITLLLVTALALGLFGCSGSQSGGTNNAGSDPAAGLAYDAAEIRANFEKAEAYADALFSGKNMTSSIQDDDESTGIYKSWYYDGKPDQTPISSEIEIDGNRIVLGETTAKDVMGFGLTANKSNENAQTGDVVTITLSKGDRGCAVMLAPNGTEEKDADDLPVYEVMTSAKDFSLPFTYCGLTVDSTLEDVLKALGTPTFLATLSSENMGVSIELDYNHLTEDGGKQTLDSLVIRLVYDTDSNTALVDNLDLRREVSSAASGS